MGKKTPDISDTFSDCLQNYLQTFWSKTKQIVKKKEKLHFLPI